MTQMSLQQALIAAIKHQQAGQFREAETIYRQILAGTEAQRTALNGWLEERYARGELIYGLHVTDRAHMTCLVFNYAGRHLHFIDGADGGLFLAARAFKERAARLTGSVYRAS